ncbi:MAG TPA: ABC transporter permease [Puia sp.]|nr:ABC transporter permease [Puia sp.]
MLKNYLKTAWRNLTKDKMHSFINVFGLCMGLTVTILISLWMYDEVSFDKNFSHYNRIARVVQNVSNNGEVQTWFSVPYPLAQELRSHYGSDFKHIAMAVNWGSHVITIADKSNPGDDTRKVLKSNGGFFEKEMQQLLTPDMLQGSGDVLNDPSSVLLAASAAKAYFGDDNPIGKVFTIDQMAPVKVAGVYKDFPHNSSFADLDFIASWDFWYHANNDLKDMTDPWRPNFVSLYAELNDNVSFSAASERIRDAKLKKVNEHLQKKKPALFLLPMSKWHLYSEFKDGVNTGGAIRYVRMFGIIGLFVLLLACINFMNLSTARSEKRAKEVGIRKTVGSRRRQLIFQFFAESLLTVGFAFVLSLLFAQLALPFFNSVSEKDMHILWNKPLFWLASIVFIVTTAAIAGSYPAFYLSSFRPVNVLKGTFKASRFAAVPRKALVVLQFGVSVSLIIGTIVVFQQIQYAKHRPVGYSRANLITVSTHDSTIHTHFNAVKDELMRTGMVASFAESESPTTSIWNSTSGFSWPGKDPNLSTDFGVITASVEYGRTVGWEVKEGRGFSKDFLTDSAAAVLNESAVSYMNLKHPVGETITWWDHPLKVIGVVRNMVINSPYDEVQPVIYTLLNYQGNVALIKLNAQASAGEAVKRIEATFKKYDPDQPFEYKFVDEDYSRKFGNEEKVVKLAGIFTVLAIMISCLGLFGLASFVAEQRKKEIGVRKVLGASVFSVWNLLSKDFVVLVVIAFLLAIPLSYYFMNNWLQNYSYRTQLSWWIFVTAGTGAVLITLITVSFQAIRAAIANPVKSLRSE